MDTWPTCPHLHRSCTRASLSEYDLSGEEQTISNSVYVDVNIAFCTLRVVKQNGVRKSVSRASSALMPFSPRILPPVAVVSESCWVLTKRARKIFLMLITTNQICKNKKPPKWFQFTEFLRHKRKF